jgi:hypothetical protein
MSPVWDPITCTVTGMAAVFDPCIGSLSIRVNE